MKTRESKTPEALIRHAWRLGLSEDRIWIPRRRAGALRASEAAMRDLARRGEQRALALGEGKASRCTDVWGRVRKEALKYGVSHSTIYNVMKQAGAAVERWWYAGERARYERLSDRRDAARALMSYQLAREAMIRGELPHDVSREIVALAADSVASAWWHHEDAGPEALIEEAAYLAVLRLDGRLDMPKAEALAKARLGDADIGPELAASVERGVERGIEALERWGKVA